MLCLVIRRSVCRGQHSEPPNGQCGGDHHARQAAGAGCGCGGPGRGAVRESNSASAETRRDSSAPAPRTPTPGFASCRSDPDDDYAFLLAPCHRRGNAAPGPRAGPSLPCRLHDALIANGWVSESDYVRAVAAHVGLPAVAGARLAELSPAASYPPWPSVMAGIFQGREVVAVEARSFAPRVLRSIAAAGDARRKRFVLATRAEMARATERQRAPALMDAAVNGLCRRSAEMSARTPHPHWQVLLLVGLVGLIIGSAVVAPDVTISALAALLALPFFCVVLTRCCAVSELLRSPARQSSRAAEARLDDASLPVYTVLVALYREAEVLPGLVRRWPLSIIPPPSCKSCWRSKATTSKRGEPPLRWTFRATSRSLSCPTAVRAPSPRPSTMRWAWRAAISSSCTMPRTCRSPIRFAALSRCLRTPARRSPACRPSSTSTMRGKLAHPSVHARIRGTLRRHPARRSSASTSPCRSAARPITFVPACCGASAPGTPTTSPRMPTSASASPAKASAPRRSPPARGRRRPSSSATGSGSARAGSRAGCRPISSTTASRAAFSGSSAGSGGLACTCLWAASCFPPSCTLGAICC